MPLLALPNEILSHTIHLALFERECEMTYPYETFNLADAVLKRNEREAWDEGVAKSLALSCRLLSELSLTEEITKLVRPTRRKMEVIKSSGRQVDIRRLELLFAHRDSERGAQLDIIASTHFLEQLEIVSQSTSHLESLNPVLAGLPCLRELTLDFMRVPKEYSDESEFFLAKLSLPSLERLHVVGLDYFPYHGLDLAKYQHLSHLTLGCEEVLQLTEFEKTLTSAPASLRHLHLVDMNCCFSGTTASLIPAVLRPQLESLVLEVSFEMDVKRPRSFGSLHGCSRLESLDLGSITLRTIDASELPQSLRRLRLHLYKDTEIENIDCLAQLPNLRLVGLGLSGIPKEETLIYLRQLRKQGKILLEGMIFKDDVLE